MTSVLERHPRAETGMRGLPAVRIVDLLAMQDVESVLWSCIVYDVEWVGKLSCGASWYSPCSVLWPSYSALCVLSSLCSVTLASSEAELYYGGG